MRELLNDTRLLKKLKKGKISEEDFEKEVTRKPKTKQKAGGPSDDSVDEDVWWSEHATKNNNFQDFFFYVLMMDFIGNCSALVINKAWWVHRWRPMG